MLEFWFRFQSTYAVDQFQVEELPKRTIHIEMSGKNPIKRMRSSKSFENLLNRLTMTSGPRKAEKPIGKEEGRKEESSGHNLKRKEKQEGLRGMFILFFPGR